MKRFSQDELNQIAYPLGGIGAGMFCVEGTGMLGQFSLRGEPDVHFEPNVFSALCVRGEDEATARILEGPVPYRKIYGGMGDRPDCEGNGLAGKNYGLPRMDRNTFEAEFPFAHLEFSDDEIPLQVELTAYSPFIPTNSDDSSLPAAELEYRFTNPGPRTVEAVYSFHAFNFMDPQSKSGGPVVREGDFVHHRGKGFLLTHVPQDPDSAKEGYFYVSTDDAQALTDTDWFNGGWFDVQTMLWNGIKAGRAQDRRHPGGKSPGGSLYCPMMLRPGESRSVRLYLTWYVPKTRLRHGWEADAPDVECCRNATHVPWYAGRFASVDEVMGYFRANAARLKSETRRFTDTFYASTLPEPVMDSIADNLTILKSPTVLRQTDGRIWAWEGCSDTCGCCTGSCTHVWNYAVALCHLFPELERTLRETEFGENQDERGHQQFRASLPIRTPAHDFHAASDGQLGGIMKMYREWRIWGDSGWLAEHYDAMEQSLEYCITTWDPAEEGVLKEPHHNTYDIEFWGADGMCSSFYLGALKAMSHMAAALGKDGARYGGLYLKGRRYVEERLYNGEYFYQETQWQGLRTPFDPAGQTDGNPQCVRLLEQEGPKYQYGTGCISDGVVGAWLAKMCGLGDILDPAKLASHLHSVYRYNFKHSLKRHENPQRPGYAVGGESGLLLCTWPQGDKPSLPFVYSDEVWTGIEHQVASHLASFGYLEEALELERAVRERYDGRKRNPFNEYECGYWYARAMSSYGLLQGITGVRYDAVEKTLYACTKNLPGYRCFLSTATGFGVVTVADGRAAVEVAYGSIPVERYVMEG